MSRREVIQTSAAPAAIGPYSQAVATDTLVFTAGQIALDPGSGRLLGEGDAAAETEQVLRNLEAVLKAAGSSLGQVLRCDVFLADMKDFQAVNAVYGCWFQKAPPARVTTQAAGLPRDARVEIAAIALR